MLSYFPGWKTILSTAAVLCVSLIVMSYPRRDLSNKTFVAYAAAANDESVKVDWRTLRGLNYRTGEKAEPLQKVDGKKVKVPGFMVPLEDEEEMAVEFLLVPYVGACIHTPPPPPNQIVYVKMDGGKKTKISFWDPVWVHGKLEVQNVRSPYGDVSFKLSSNFIEPYKD
jgi:hypothetical protein